MRRFRALATCAFGSQMLGCAALIGPREAPQAPLPFHPREATLSTALPALRATATLVGPGQRVVAARNLLGGVTRVVNPFGARNLVVALELSAAGGALLKPADARLSYDGQAPLAPLGLDQLRRRWPTWAIRNEEEAADQRLAYEQVLDRLLMERRLAPAESTKGVLVFPLRPLRQRLSLSWPTLAGGVPGTLRFEWEAR